MQKGTPAKCATPSSKIFSQVWEAAFFLKRLEKSFLVPTRALAEKLPIRTHDSRCQGHGECREK